MTYIAKQTTNNISSIPVLNNLIDINSGSTPIIFYELFTSQILKDINGNDVEIPISIGSFTLEQLNGMKANLQSQMDDLDERIKTIQG